MPHWKQLGYDFETDTDIIIGNLNCENQDAFCQSLSIKGFPTFLSSFRNSLGRPQFHERTYHTFVNEIFRLKDLRSAYSVFLDQIRNVASPPFLVRVAHSDSPNREVAERVIKDSGLGPLFAFDFKDDYIDNTSVIVQLDANRTRDMTGPFEYQIVADFVGDNLVVPFGDWTFAALWKLKRLFAIYYPLGDMDIPKDVRDWALVHEYEVLFGNLKSLGKKNCRELFNISLDILPVVVFINPTASTYYVVDMPDQFHLDRFMWIWKGNMIVMQPFKPIVVRQAVAKSVAKKRRMGGIVVGVILVLVVVTLVVLRFVRARLSSKQD
jgi:hypothetical protein